jgi:hypothetical protein
MIEMPKYAPLVIVMFLGACSGLLFMGLAFLYGLIARKRWVMRVSVALAASGILIYAILLLGFSLASSDKVLSFGDRKHFCEVDCHIAYSVTSVTSASRLGVGEKRISAAGKFYIVRVQTWFDPSTISSFRGNSPLAPSPRKVVVFDEAGREFTPSQPGQRTYELTPGATTTPLTTPLRPGESYTTDFVFDLPVDVRQPRLLVGDVDPISALIIGHEDSPLHKKIYFTISPPSSTNNAKNQR